MAVECRMANLLLKAMKENDCPEEQYARIGFPNMQEVREEDILFIHKREENRLKPSVLLNYQWTKGAINAYRALLKFIPADRKKWADDMLEAKIPCTVSNGEINANTVIKQIPEVIPEAYTDMVEYFVGLSGRTS